MEQGLLALRRRALSAAGTRSGEGPPPSPRRAARGEARRGDGPAVARTAGLLATATGGRSRGGGSSRPERGPWRRRPKVKQGWRDGAAAAARQGPRRSRGARRSMRAPGPSPSAAKLLVPRFGIDSASSTGLLPPARPPRAQAEAPLPRGLHSSLGHGELQGTAPAASRQSRRRCGSGVVQQPWRPRAPVARPPRRRAGPLSLEFCHASPSTSPRWSPLAAAGHPRRPCPPPASLCPCSGRPWLPRRCCCCSSSPRRRRPCSGSSWPRRGGASRGLPHHLQRRPAGGGVEAARRSSPRQLVRGVSGGKMGPDTGGVADVR
ncbi:hypothetical protein PVAP13_9NG666100 [Panicum virgatum]|uniref:Uncharacterized protein n=1 Tax=Panicum virgatum TaxID=38727 RepID=A0A8T0N4C4_PANVG|nr:hypothetical protein PVAP13_9NG666100 [Panicum virgatum]